MNAKSKPDATAVTVPNAPGNSNERSDKDKNFARQFKIVFDAFGEYPKTMAQVAVETNVMRSNITRYVAVMKRQKTIRLIAKGRCPITGMSGVGLYLTDKTVEPAPYIPAPAAAPVMCSMPKDESSKPAVPGFHQLSLFPDYE